MTNAMNTEAVKKIFSLNNDLHNVRESIKSVMFELQDEYYRLQKSPPDVRDMSKEEMLAAILKVEQIAKSALPVTDSGKLTELLTEVKRHVKNIN